MLKTRAGDVIGTGAPATFLRLPEVKRRVGVSTPTIYRWVAAGVFPRPIRVGDNTSAWIESEVAAWQRDRIAARDAERGEAA